MPSYQEEKEFLDKLYTSYSLSNAPQTQALRKLTLKVILPFFNKAKAVGLELGCSDGLMTEALAMHMTDLHVVDASEQFINEAKIRAPKNVDFFCSLFEEFDPSTKYDYIIASFILEHVLDPVVILQNVKKWLKQDGLLFIIVPNARAMSRQLALHMNLLKDLKDLTENDLKFGHRRVYDRVYLNKDIDEAGLEQISQGGIMFKILADFQLDQLIGEGFLQDEHIEGLYKLGLEYPDFASSLFSICQIK